MVFFRGAEKRLKAAKALKEKGETPEELLLSIKENEKAVAEAEKEVDAWKAIVGEKSRREEAAKAEAERIATEKAEAERKAAEERERAEKEEKARIEAEKKEAERIAAEKAEEEARVEDEKKAEEEAVEKDAELKEDKKKPQLKDVVKAIYEKGKSAASRLYKMAFFDVAKTPDFMKKLGLTGDRFTIKYGVLSRHAGKDDSHSLTEKQWEELPDALQKPFAITRFGGKDKGYRLYTTMKNENGETIVVGVDVKNVGRDMEVNAISTIFGRRGDAKKTQKEDVLYTAENITPEQRSLLGQPNSDQYTGVRERNVSTDKGSEKAEKKQEKQSVFDKAKEIADKEEKKRKAEADKPKQKPLTEAERKDAEEVAGALGYRVEWVDTMEENGTIDADRKVIRIAKDAENPLVQVLGHEVAHGVKRMIGGKFRTLQKAAMEVVGEKEWNERIEKKRELNAYAEGKLAEEVTCDIVGEALNDKDALKRLAESLRGEKGILARLRDAVARMVEYFKNRGDKEGVRRMKAADKLLAEFESALKKGVAPEQVKPEGVDRSVRENRSEKTELTEEERELRDNLVERMRKGGLDVVTDSEEMQRVIDTENERTRNMFVGEKGATEADKAEEVSTRLDNLSVARRMEEVKKDAKTIKMATGWERGSDGKWRYETSDIKPKPFEEWMDKKNLKLGDIIDSDSGLFEMYPELKDFKVTRGKGKSTNASIYTELGKIEINFSKFKPYMSIPSNREKIDGILHRVINHEIQHAIQDSEGFAQGVSPNAFRPDAPVGKLREMEEADGRMVERYNAMSYTEKTLGEGVRLKERILENRREYNALASKYRFGMDGYTRAAGEVEARNTEKRIGMTEEERRASLASETEDVAREDQILLGVDNADGEVNTGSVREHRVYHGSGADFDAFDHSHMGEGEGAQAYGWGTYVTEVEGIGRTYAVQNTTKHNDALRALQHDVDAISDQLNRHRDDLKYDEEQLKRANEWRAEAELDYELFKDEAEKLKEKYGDASPEYRNHLFNDIYTDEMKRAQNSVKNTEESIQYRKEKIAELEKALKDKQAEVDELPKKFPRHLYTVEIPDDNGSNYLDWDGHPAESLLKDVGLFLESNGFERVQDSPVRYEKGESTVVLNPNATGADLYAELQEALGGDKKASQALAELGYTGIKYPADNMRGGRKDGAKNYVIFNENDAKITDHVRFLRTAGGEVYGLVKDGRIYLDPKVATSKTAVHEYTHLWGDMLRRKDSEQWSRTVKELKNSVLWEEVKELYPELKTDDEIADEVLSTFSGRRGAERLREEARRVADGEGGVFTKAKAIETLERVKEAIARFWEGVARMFGINRYRSAEELADMAMRDLLDSKNPMKDESGMRKRGEVGETLATSGTYFSGGGLLEAGLKGVIDPKVAVEFSEKIAGVYADNHGNHIVVADVRDVDPKKLVGAVDGGEVQYFHASPVCKNFSKAKREGGEVELDKETALSTAEFIAKTRPKVVTIENVKGYRNSEALKIITDELTRQGYDWDADVYNAADYGGYTKRERLIVRAKRDGKLPPKPEKLPEELRKNGWYSAVEDLIPHLEEKKTGVPQGTDERLKNSGIDYRTIDKPLYVFGRGYANKTVGHAFADELLPTLTTGGGDIIIMPDGRVLKASPRVLARVTGLPDTYKMPETDQLSHTIVGNGIPTQLTEGVIAPLLDNAIPSAERATKRESVFDVADRVSQNLEERTRAMRSEYIDRKYPNWLDGTTTDSGRHSTQVEGTRKTYNKVGDWIEKNIGKDVKILDASSGLGYGTADLKKRGFNIEDVEPYQSEERKKNNPATYSSYDDIPKDYDVIISNAVLNVIPDNWRSDVLHNMADHLKSGGIMFINTRKAGEERLIKDKIELDSPQEVLVKRNGKIASYQRFFAPKELKEWVEKELGNGYEVETANENNSGTKGLAAVVVKKTDAGIDRSVREFNPIELSNEDRQKRGDALRGAEPIDVKIKQIVKTKDMSARKAAEKWWKDNVGASRFYDTEIGLVEINKASVGSSLAHRYSQVKLDAITSLADGFNNAVYLGSMPDFSRQEGVKSHYFAYPINYNGHRNYVFCRAMQDANKNRLYVHEVFLADNIEKGNTLQTAASQPHGGITLYKDILANVLTANVTNNFETSKPRLSRKPGESIFDYASRVSDSVDRSVRERVSARDEYEKKVKSKGFQTKEALQNSMLGLQEFMYAIDHASGNKRYIEDIPDFENPILGENRLSSVNKEESHSRFDAVHSPTPTKGVRKPYLRSESSADGDAEGIETTMELLRTGYYGQDNIDVLRRFLQPVQQPRKGMGYHSSQGFRCTF